MQADLGRIRFVRSRGLHTTRPGVRTTLVTVEEGVPLGAPPSFFAAKVTFAWNSMLETSDIRPHVVM